MVLFYIYISGQERFSDSYYTIDNSIVKSK